MRKLIVMIPAILGWIAGCSIKAPEVHVTGEMTALEREVLGTYQEMEEDTWMIASTRAARGDSEVRISPEKRKVLDALQEQKFNKDDIDEFKRKGYVGEGNTGFLVLRASQDLESDTEQMAFVQEIVEEENQDREVIMERVVELNDSLQESKRDDILGIFAKMNQESSPQGTWIQRADGSWMKK